MRRPYIAYLPGAAPNECRANITLADGDPQPAIVRVGHAGSHLEVVLLGGPACAPVAKLTIPYDQARKLAEVVVDAVYEVEGEKPPRTPPDPDN